MGGELIYLRFAFNMAIFYLNVGKSSMHGAFLMFKKKNTSFNQRPFQVSGQGLPPFVAEREEIHTRSARGKIVGRFASGGGAPKVCHPAFPAFQDVEKTDQTDWANMRCG